MNRIVVLLTIVVFCAALAPAPAQDEQTRQLALETLNEREKTLLTQTPEELKAQYVRNVRESALKLFSRYGTEAQDREYAPEERDYAGERGRLSQEQVAALKTFVAPFLEEPPRALTQEERQTVAKAFALADDDVALKEIAFKAYVVEIWGDAPGTPTPCALFGEKISDNIFRATFDEIQPRLEAVLEKNTPVQVLDELNQRSNLDRIVLLECLLERFPERMDDYAYAAAVHDATSLTLALGRVDSGTRPDQNQRALDRAVEILERARAARPDSWEVSLVVAQTIWTFLPHCFNPGSDDASQPRRVVFSPDNPPLLDSRERDRVEVIAILAHTLTNALDAVGTERDPSDETTVVSMTPRRNINCSSYFKLLSDSLRMKSRILGGASDLSVRTNLNELPPLKERQQGSEEATDAPQTDASVSDAEQVASVGVGDDELQEPLSFANLPNDAQRLDYANLLVSAENRTHAVGTKNENRRELFLATLGVSLQGKFGVSSALSKLQTYQRVNRSNPAAFRENFAQKQEQINAFLEAIPSLKENETYLDYAAPKNARDFQPKKRVLSKYFDFMSLLKESVVKLNLPAAAVALGSEYQARGDYHAALEAFQRAQQSPSSGPLKEKIDVAIARIQNRRALYLDADKTSVCGTRVSFDVVSRGVRSLKTTFFQIDLAPFVAQSREKSFCSDSNSRFFADLVLKGVSDKLLKETPVSDFAREVRTSIDRVAEDSENNAAQHRTSLTFTMEKPGAYLIRVADETNDASGVYAFAFVNRLSFAFQFDRLIVSDVETGKPFANREIEVLYRVMESPSLEGRWHTKIVKTDDAGAAETPKGTITRLIAFAQEETPDEFDRSVSVFDSQDAPFVPEVVVQPRQTFSDFGALVLTTDRPLYLPGDTARFSVQFVPKFGKAPGPKSAHVRVQSENGKLLLSEFDVKFDENMSYSGSFPIPQSVAPGRYLFSQGNVSVNANSGASVFIAPLSSTIYVARDPNERIIPFDGPVNTSPAKSDKPTESESAETSPQAAATDENDAALADKADAFFSPDSEPLLTVEFDKPRYTSQDEYAEIVLKSPVSDAVVSISKIGNDRRTQTVERVQLQDGAARYRCKLEKDDWPSFTTLFNVVHDKRAQAFYYRVGYSQTETLRDVELDASARVKRGEKVEVNARFAPLLDDGALFKGRATLAVYDSRFDATTSDDYSTYFDAYRVENEFLGWQETPATPMYAPTPLRLSPYSLPNGNATLYDDFIEPPTSLKGKWEPSLSFNEISAWRKKTARQNPSTTNGPSGNVPAFPDGASLNSILLEKTVAERVGTLSMEFIAPETPGTYRMTFKAFDLEKGCASLAERELIVE